LLELFGYLDASYGMALPLHPIFLVVDHNADSRLLLTKPILRRFPGAIMQECETMEASLAALQRTSVDAIVSHRVIGYDGATTVQMFRRVNSHVPIVMVSGIDRAREAYAAGANVFVNFDAWLTMGAVVEQILRERATPEAAAEPVA